MPATPYLWADKSAPATGKRFYRAVSMAAPTNMVFIPPGTFRMGSPTNEVDRDANEGPQTAVTISRGFWMGKYPVTQGDYLAVMGGNPSYFSTNNGYAEDLSVPVESVSWLNATNCFGLGPRAPRRLLEQRRLVLPVSEPQLRLPGQHNHRRRLPGCARPRPALTNEC